MAILIASDHVGLNYKTEIFESLYVLKYAVEDYGCYSTKKTDYPIYASKVAKDIAAGISDLGILICGTGVGMAIVANKIKGIRAVVTSDCYTAKLSKEHNNANILAIGSRVIGLENAKLIVKIWLEAKFDSRHQYRLDMISQMENIYENKI